MISDGFITKAAEWTAPQVNGESGEVGLLVQQVAVTGACVGAPRGHQGALQLNISQPKWLQDKDVLATVTVY